MRINGLDLVPFSGRERSILIALGLRQPGLLGIRDLIPCVYPDPDLEPDHAEMCIRAAIRNIGKNKARLLGDWRLVAWHGSGYGLWPKSVYSLNAGLFRGKGGAGEYSPDDSYWRVTRGPHQVGQTLKYLH